MDPSTARFGREKKIVVPNASTKVGRESSIASGGKKQSGSRNLTKMEQPADTKIHPTSNKSVLQ